RPASGNRRNQSRQSSTSADRAGSWNGTRRANPEAQRGICPPRAPPTHNPPAWLAGYVEIVFHPANHAQAVSLFQGSQSYSVSLVLHSLISLPRHSVSSRYWLIAIGAQLGVR